MKKFKEELIGRRIVLKATKPTEKDAQETFTLIDLNRQHLSEFLDWVATTQKVSDTMNSLVKRSIITKRLEEIQYGIYLENKLIGIISMSEINHIHKFGEIGYWLAKKHTGNGYMSEAIKSLEQYFFAEFGLNRIAIYCDERNIASQNVAKKSGYLYEGLYRENRFHKKTKSFSSGMAFAKLKSDWDKE